MHEPVEYIPSIDLLAVWILNLNIYLKSAFCYGLNCVPTCTPNPVHPMLQDVNLFENSVTEVLISWEEVILE